MPGFACAEVSNGKHSATPCLPENAYVCKAPSGTLNALSKLCSRVRLRFRVGVLLEHAFQCCCCRQATYMRRAQRRRLARRTRWPVLPLLRSHRRPARLAVRKVRGGQFLCTSLHNSYEYIRMDSCTRILWRSDVCVGQSASLPVIRNADQQTWIDYRFKSGTRYWLALLPDPEVRTAPHTPSPPPLCFTHRIGCPQASPELTSRRWKWPNGEQLVFASWHLNSWTGIPDNIYQKYARTLHSISRRGLQWRPFVHEWPQLPRTQERDKYRSSLFEGWRVVVDDYWLSA